MFKTKKSRSEAEENMRTFASSDVSRIAQVSLRQLQWWDERKVVSPRQDGHKRVYMPEEVVEISVIAELRRKGFSLQKIRRVLKYLQREMGKRLGDARQSLAHCWNERHRISARTAQTQSQMRPRKIREWKKHLRSRLSAYAVVLLVAEHAHHFHRQRPLTEQDMFPDGVIVRPEAVH